MSSVFHMVSGGASWPSWKESNNLVYKLFISTELGDCSYSTLLVDLQCRSKGVQRMLAIFWVVKIKKKLFYSWSKTSAQFQLTDPSLIFAEGEKNF